MKMNLVLAVVASLLAGAALMYLLRPAPESPSAAGQSDEKYVVVESEGGHWIYEKTEEGLVVRVKELGPDGLGAIWGLQAKFLPYTVDIGGTTFVNVPATAYSTETGAFQVIHRFYKHADDKLVEVQMEGLPAPKK